MLKLKLAGDEPLPLDDEHKIGDISVDTGESGPSPPVRERSKFVIGCPLTESGDIFCLNKFFVH